MSRPRFAPGSTVVFRVKNRSGKKPLATYLGSRLGVVDAWADDLIASGHVDVDGVPARSGDRINLSAGPHAITVRFPLAWPRHMAATEMPLDVLHEDKCIVVLNKPAGTVVHPARGHLDNRSLQNGVRHRYRHLLGMDHITIGSPHRLDKDTSGVIVFAITRAAYVALVDQFSSGRPHKEYLAVVDGIPAFGETVCELPLGVDPGRKGCGTVLPAEAGGKTARTDFTVLERGAGWALVRAVPHTGRPHQIRIHAAALGIPLAGDAEYNPVPGRLGFRRQALHAHALSFPHPETGTPLRIEAPTPPDMLEGLATLRTARPAGTDAGAPPPGGRAEES